VLISVRSAAALATAKVLTRQWLYINHLSAFLKKKRELMHIYTRMTRG